MIPDTQLIFYGPPPLFNHRRLPVHDIFVEYSFSPMMLLVFSLDLVGQSYCFQDPMILEIKSKVCKDVPCTKNSETHHRKPQLAEEVSSVI